MKKRTIFSVLIIFTSLLMILSGCFSAVLYEYAGEENGVKMYANKYTKSAYAGTIIWDGDRNNMEYTVPNMIDDCKVSQLGGYYGSGGISHFTVNIPQIFDGREVVHYYSYTPEEMTEENSEELIFTVNIGQNINTLERGDIVAYLGYGEASTRTIEMFYMVKLHFICDEDNPTFYSRDGVLYYKSNDQKAEFKY